MADLDNQIEMERAQAQLEYAPNSAFGSTAQNVQGGGGSVQTASATQDTQSLEEEEETNLPDPFEEEINLPEWFEDLLDFGNELLKPWSQSGEGISHGVGRVPRAVVAWAGFGRTEPQRHAAPCVAPIRASREADEEHAPAPPPALSQPFGCEKQQHRAPTPPAGRGSSAARPPSPQPGPSNRLSPPPPLEAAARRRRPRKVYVPRRIPLPANDDDYDHPSPAHSSIGWTPSCSNSNNSNFLMASGSSLPRPIDNEFDQNNGVMTPLEYSAVARAFEGRISFTRIENPGGRYRDPVRFLEACLPVLETELLKLLEDPEFNAFKCSAVLCCELSHPPKHQGDAETATLHYIWGDNGVISRSTSIAEWYRESTLSAIMARFSEMEVRGSAKALSSIPHLDIHIHVYDLMNGGSL
ncbi:uncharacterized protein LOC126475133 isoform X2 [Schistocerca serialis cubense]|uniref:uncharacterized protein LOC126475133 isoform X2 n=1 Tax=Schistocerca serialis cubense TaxID=2023355 RepID=UPI00214F3CD5|nr:uncharacterized protein LOC126475133 isoform X2 [Schistocerca serialis cubense]